MDNNGQNAQGQQEPQATPTLDGILNGANTPLVTPAEQGGTQPASQEGQQGQQEQQFQTTPATVVPKTNGTPAPNGTEGQENPPIEKDDVLSFLSADVNTLSEDDKALKQNVFSTFGASSIDATGNLLNEQGQVVLSKANLDKYIETGEVLLDANGNQIDETGKILKNASDLSTTNTIIDISKAKIEEELGFQLLDAEGKPKNYVNSVEGNTELLKDVANTATINAISAFLNANPEMKDIYYHLANGGKIGDYTAATIDYGAIDVTQLDRNQMLGYIKTSLEKQGVKNATSLIKTLEQSSDEVLTQNTADAIMALKQLSEEDKIAREQQYQQKEQDEQKQLEDYWNEVKGVITKGNLKDINIPVNEREEFFKYLAVPINSKGESQEMVDAEKEDNEFRLMLSYLRYKGYDLSKLIETRAKTNRLDSLRNRVGVPNPKIENAQARTNGQAQVDAAGFPTLDQLTKR